MVKTEKPEREKDAAWERVAAELKRQGKGLQWLADKLDTSVQRVQNWTTRGLPGKSYAEVAQALGESADWIVGLAEPKWKQERAAPPTDREKLSTAAVAVGATYDRMSVAQQELFLRLLEASFGAPVHVKTPRPHELGHSDMMDLDLDISEADPRKERKHGTGS